MAAAETPAPTATVKIAVFPFELEDFSAAASVVARDAEKSHLAEATEEAKQQLVESGRYSLIDTKGAETDKALQDCEGCEATLAAKLGADQSLLGVVSKISNTEYVIKLKVRDARSGEIVANYTSELRMGADYSWPRGVRSSMKNHLLVAK